MTKQSYIYVTNMGMLVRMTPRQYKDFLNQKAGGYDAMPDYFGTLVGVVQDVTDLSAEDAKDILSEKR